VNGLQQFVASFKIQFRTKYDESAHFYTSATPSVAIQTIRPTFLGAILFALVATLDLDSVQQVHIFRMDEHVNGTLATLRDGKPTGRG